MNGCDAMVAAAASSIGVGFRSTGGGFFALFGEGLIEAEDTESGDGAGFCFAIVDAPPITAVAGPDTINAA